MSSCENFSRVWTFTERLQRLETEEHDCHSKISHRDTHFWMVTFLFPIEASVEMHLPMALWDTELKGLPKEKCTEESVETEVAGKDSRWLGCPSVFSPAWHWDLPNPQRKLTSNTFDSSIQNPHRYHMEQFFYRHKFHELFHHIRIFNTQGVETCDFQCKRFISQESSAILPLWALMKAR